MQQKFGRDFMIGQYNQYLYFLDQFLSQRRSRGLYHTSSQMGGKRSLMQAPWPLEPVSKLSSA